MDHVLKPRQRFDLQSRGLPHWATHGKGDQGAEPIYWFDKANPSKSVEPINWFLIFMILSVGSQPINR